MRAGRLLTCLGGASALTLVALKWLPVPFAWTLAGWVLALILSIPALRSRRARLAFLNLAVAAAALCAFEVHATSWVPEDSFLRNERTYAAGYWTQDPLLGTAPVPGTASPSRSTRGDALLYDVVYSIDRNGLRKAPPVRLEPPRGCAAFFGCSFTYGEGLHDDETMPYRVGIDSGGAWRICNFAFHAYGAQHMLAALETGRVAEAAGCRPTHVVYQAIPDHVPRAAGLHAFSRKSPRYLLQADGSVRRQGRHDDDDRPPTAVEVELRYQLQKSHLFRELASGSRAVTDADVRLWIGIVDQARRVAREKYGCDEFHVLLWQWDSQMPIYDRMLEALRRAGIRHHLVCEILPDFDRDPGQYEIPLDRHPNARANQVIARYVVERILSASGQAK